jgi:hypothetical protein
MIYLLISFIVHFGCINSMLHTFHHIHRHCAHSSATPKVLRICLVEV